MRELIERLEEANGAMPVKLNRVMYDKDGGATSPEMAKQKHGVEPVLILVRDDGWSMGVPADIGILRVASKAGKWKEAYMLRRGQWIPSSIMNVSDNMSKLIRTGTF